jgi:integrase
MFDTYTARYTLFLKGSLMANYRHEGDLTVDFCDSVTKPGKYSDGSGLYLRVTIGKRGRIRKSWIWLGELRGQRRGLGLGTYTNGYASPNGLKATRRKAQEYNKLKSDGRDPKLVKQEERRAAALKERGNVTFRVAIEEYLKLQENRWRSEATALDWTNRFRRTADALVGTPKEPLGDLAMREVRPEHMADALRSTWHDPVGGVRLRRRLDEFFRDFAVARGFTDANPAGLAQMTAQLGRRRKHRPMHFKALPHAQVGEFMAQLRVRRGDDMAGAALEFMLLTAVRTKQVVLVRWNEIQLDHRDGPLWVCPGEHTKNGEPLEIPLSAAAVSILKSLPGEHRPDDLVFPGARRDNAPLGRNSIRRFAQDKMGRGKDVTAHGFRSTFRDWVAEERPVDPEGKPYPAEAAEAALHHAGGNATELAYRRTAYLRIRRGLMEAWAHYCTTPSHPKAQSHLHLVA